MPRIWSVFPLLAIFFNLIGTTYASHDARTTIDIGVLARRGSVECLQEWSPTAQYLTDRIPGTSFRIVPLNFQEIAPAVQSEQVDFVIANQYVYVELQNLYGVSRMVTIKRLTPQGHTSLFGGIIFCRADREGISSINDLKGRSFAAVDVTSFGGWMVGWRELKKHGIYPQKDFSTLTFSGTHDDVVRAVRDGKVEAGTVATPILEQMIAEGKIAPGTFRILNKNDAADFPYALSTRLYPEWPFARLKHISDDVAEKVAIALLDMPLQSSAAKSAGSAGWTVPLDYTSVEACMKELQVGIYKDYGRITLAQLFTEYHWQVFSVIAALAVLASLLLYSMRLNRRLLASESILQKETIERRRANEELAKANEFLQHSRQQLANIIDFLPDATFVIDKDKKIIAWNRAIEEMAGVSKEDMIGQGDNAHTVPFYGERRKQLLDLIDDDDEKVRKTYLHFSRKDRTLYAEAFAPALNNGRGASIWVTGAPLFDADGNRAGAIESIRDITEQKQTEAEREKLKSQLLQAQKMESIGTLAGGLAHDFNNILGALLGYAEMARDDSPAGSAVAGDIAQVIKAGIRARDLVKQILVFSRQIQAERIPLQPAIIVKEAVKLLRPSLPSTIEIRQDISPTSPVLADPAQFQQILVNLCTNAYHAMEETGGILTISVKNTDLAPEDLAQDPHIEPGEFVQISVSDTGSGMGAEIQERIFDPYFTTKEPGKGSGMGLAVVHGIVKSYRGFLSCYSKPGEGTVFHVFLPVITKDAAAETAAVDLIPVGNERILFIDDEEMLAEMGQTMLTRLGYTVTVKRSSLEALTTFLNQPDQFDLVITDQTMPGMTGVDLARRMLQIRPDLPIILCTGFSTLISEDKARAMGIKAFVLKPIAKKDIAGLIRRVLDGTTGS